MVLTTDGVGIEFENNGVACITLPRSECDCKVRTEIITYAGIATSEGHFYASLHISDLSFHKMGDESSMTSWSNMQPKESRFDRTDVTMKAPKAIYGDVFGRKMIEVRKGFPTSRFENVQDCLAAIESTFKKEFYNHDSKWVLSGPNDELWEEYKKEW